MLDYIDKLPENKLLADRLLVLKTTMLLALCSGVKQNFNLDLVVRATWVFYHNVSGLQ